MSEELIASGHSDPLDYSPRQLNAFYELATARRRRAMADQFSVVRAAHHASQKDATKFMKQLTEGSK